MTNLDRGLLIAVEGCDRAGKSTQCRLLVEKLNSLSIPAKLYRFPDRTTPIGGIISDYLTADKAVSLNDHSIHLLFSANRWEIIDQIVQDLNKGVTVIMDRYLYSGIAFSCAKGLDYNWCKAADIGLVLPDMALYLDLSIDEIVSRGGFGAERYETAEFQAKVRQVFEKFWLGQKPTDTPSIWKRIDAAASIESLHETLLETVRTELSKSRNELRLFQ